MQILFQAGLGEKCPWLHAAPALNVPFELNCGLTIRDSATVDLCLSALVHPLDPGIMLKPKERHF
jgi:hypothetical protein